MNPRDVEKDHYAALGVPKDASAADIKKAYRKLARQLHPDANPGDSAAEERFKAVSEAYDVLSDDAKRREYDEMRSLFANGGGFRMPGGGGPGGGFRFDTGDLFGGGSISDLFGGLFGGAGGQRRPGPQRGADLETSVRVSFRDAVDGATVPVRVATEVSCVACRGTGGRDGHVRTCPTCQGTGSTSHNAGGFALSEPCRTCRGQGTIVDEPCPVCRGSGRTVSDRSVRARIPAGIADGARIRLKGQGGEGQRGGPRGDLYVSVAVTPHPVFGRRGSDLTVSVPVTFPEAALGADVPVPTLEGDRVTVRLAAGTRHGLTQRVRGRGGAKPGGGRGDLLVTFEVAVPAKLSRKATEALQDFAAATSEDDPRADLLARAGSSAAREAAAGDGGSRDAAARDGAARDGGPGRGDAA